jgi:hypothetical protein
MTDQFRQEFMEILPVRCLQCALAGIIGPCRPHARSMFDDGEPGSPLCLERFQPDWNEKAALKTR